MAKPLVVKLNDEVKENIDNISLASMGAYLFFDEVNSETTKDLCEFLVKANYIFGPTNQSVTILVNSPGGDVYDGFGIVDLMECSKVKIQTVGIGQVVSMASLIFTAGSKGLRVMSRNSFIMTHQFYSYFEGKYHELVAQRDHDDALQERFVQHFLKHSKMTEKQIKSVLLAKSDYWIDAKEALKLGLCDKIQDPWEK